MAIEFLTNLDLNRNEILNARLQNLATDPTGLGPNDNGRIWISGGIIKYWDGTTTQTLGLATGGNAESLDGMDGTYYLNRANHTGTQTAATISDLPETVQDLVGAMIGGTQTNITVTYDDTSGTLSFSVPEAPAPYVTGVGDTATLDLTVTGGNLTGAVLDSPTVGGLTPAQLRDRATHTGQQTASTISDFTETAQDAVGNILGDTATLDLTYDDATPGITGTVLDSPTVGGQTPAQLRARSSHTGTQAASTISDFAEAVDDRMNAALLVSGALTKTYDDVANTLTLGVNINGGDAGTLDGLDSAAFEKIANKGTANGYASLDGTGKIPSAQLPALALTDVNVVATTTARDALTVQEGDVAIVTGNNTSYIYDGTTWQEMRTPTDGVTAVTGGTGITSSGGTTPEISLTAGGVGTTQLADNAVTNAKLADAAVNTAELVDGAVTTLKIGDAQVTAAKLATSAVDLTTTKVTGTLPATKGGTGQATYAVGDLLIGGATNTLTKLADVATGSVLLSGGVGAAPTYGKVGLTTHVSGTLAIANGGTGATTAAAARSALGATTKFAANIGDGAATEYTITHNLNSRDVQVDVYSNAAPYDTVWVDVERTTVNTTLIRFAQAPAAGAYRVVVVG